MVAVEGVAEEALEQCQIYRLPGTLLLMCNPKQGFLAPKFIFAEPLLLV